MGKKEIFQSGERFRKESTDFSILQTSIKVCCRIRLKLKLRLRNIETSWNCGSGAELPQPNEINTNNPQPLTAQQLKGVELQFKELLYFAMNEGFLITVLLNWGHEKRSSLLRKPLANWSNSKKILEGSITLGGLKYWLTGYVEIYAS